MAPRSVLLMALALVGAIYAKSPLPRDDLTLYAADTEEVSIFNHRLDATSAPTHYTLRLSPDFTSFGYAGNVAIETAARQAGVNTITLQSQDLTPITISVMYNGNNVYQSFTLDTQFNNLIINLNSAMVYNPTNAQIYTINIAFQGTLRTDMYGFYRSWYMHDGAVRWMATTQFQATSARAAFPCYDEPSFKATFDVIIERPTTYSSWSNMRLQSSVPAETAGRMVDTYHRTPVMSTYLLAFIVAEYDSISANNPQGQLAHEVIARPNAISTGQGAYALDLGQRLLAAMDEHTGYPFATMNENIKMTQAAIPDFGAGAMENWGLLTYREAYLMYDSAHTNSRFQERIAYILSHEIAHMWFGNLVTCEWWDVLWLNEGFARYYQYFLTDWVEPQMGFETRFIAEQVHSSLFADSIDSAHPLSNPLLESPASVSAHFSTITYNKGAAVIRMTEHLMGSENHRQGLQNYLTARSFDTAVPSHLFDALDAAGDTLDHYGYTIDEYYRSWTEKAGYPLLQVDVNHQTGDMTIRQSRFERNTGSSSIDSTWIVPITFASAENPDFGNTRPTHTIRDAVTVINRGTTGDQWIIFNKQQTGFYRVNYDDYTWGLITLALRGPQRTLIHEYNRAQIVDDVFQQARAGLMSYTRALNILSFLEYETDYAPWAAAISGFNWLHRRFVGQPQGSDIESVFVGWATPVMNQLTYYPIANEPWMRSFLRLQLAPVMCRLGVPDCRAAATAQFVQLRDNSVEVPVDSRNWVYCNALRDGTVADFTFLWNRFQSHGVYTEKILLLETVGCTPHAASLATFLNAITTENTLIRPQDYGTAMSSAITGNEANTLTVLAWIQNNWAQYASTFNNAAGYVNTISSRMTSDADLAALETWTNTNQALIGANAQTSILNGIASTRQLRVWTTGITPAVVEYLTAGYQELETTTPGPTLIVETPDKDNDYRLPVNTHPRHYNLFLSPNFEDFTYRGVVEIDTAATQTGVNLITLQSQDLDIISVSVTYNNVDILQAYTLNATYNWMYISLNTDMVYNAANEQLYNIRIEFQGSLRTDMAGFYRSWYTHNDQVRWMATTQFQSTSARAAFPCYDEPSFKATFDVTIERPNSYSSWSNMRLQGSVPAVTGGRTVDTFYRTPVMSTYLLAFIVAEYDSLPANNAQGQLVHEVIARPNAIATGQGAYALDLGQRLLAQMDTHTGIEFASMAENLKMTQASIPDFSAGAMENWGLLTYREAYLMYDPAHTSSQFQQIIAYILSHEIAHMWFGNLVTCEWWDVLWLNEGFARYYQYFLTDWVEPQMGFETRFIPEQVHSSLFADSIDSAHPLTDLRLDSPASVSAHFSTITYNKGAAVIRMTEHLMGSEVHRQGLQNYLTARSYDTARPSDLFSALDVVGTNSGALAAYGPSFTIDEYYRTWTEQAGYPLLYVHVDHQTGDMTIEQRRFDRDSGYSSSNSRWIIPISFTSAESIDFSDTKPTHILRDTLTVINRGSTGDQWTIFNKQQTGFYRVNYDDYTWGLITLALRGPQRTLIHEYNVAQIVDDVFQLARADLMSYTRAFNILSFLEYETRYAPWLAAISGFNWLHARFVGTPHLANLENMFAGWAANVMSELTYHPIANEPWMRSYLRQMLAPVMCRINVPDCRTAATLQFVELRGNGVEVPNDSRAWVYCNALRSGTADDWTFLWNRYLNHAVYTEKILLLQNLGCTSNAASLNTFLNAIVQENFDIRPQDYVASFNSALNGNEANTLIVFNWIQNNYPLFANAFTNEATQLNALVARLRSDSDIQTVETWMNNNQAQLGTGVHSSVTNGIASTRQLRVWTNTITPAVVDYINVGYTPLEPSTEAPEEPTDAPTTILPPEVEAPEVPDPEPDAGTALTTSLFTMLLALAAAALAARQ